MWRELTGLEEKKGKERNKEARLASAPLNRVHPAWFDPGAGALPTQFHRAAERSRPGFCRLILPFLQATNNTPRPQTEDHGSRSTGAVSFAGLTGPRS